jgi:DNA-binding NtrC family response regulator
MRPALADPELLETSRVMVVDDEEPVRRIIRRVLEKGRVIEEASTIQEARRKLATGDFALVLCDIRMDGESGLDLAREVCETTDAAVVMVTGVDDPHVADRALEMGVYGYLVKPFTPNELRITVTSALRRHSLERSRAQLEEEARELRLLAQREEIGTDLYKAVIDHLFRVGLSLESALRMPMAPETAARVRSALDDLDDTIRRARMAIMGLQEPDGVPPAG